MSSGFFDQFSGGSMPNESNDKNKDKKKWGKQKKQNKREKKILKNLDSRVDKLESKVDATNERLSTIEGFLRAACQRQGYGLPDNYDPPKLK